MNKDKIIKAVILTQEELKKLSIGQAISMHILNSRLALYPTDPLHLPVRMLELKN